MRESSVLSVIWYVYGQSRSDSQSPRVVSMIAIAGTIGTGLFLGSGSALVVGDTSDRSDFSLEVRSEPGWATP
jgi:hypothetical protein